MAINLPKKFTSKKQLFSWLDKNHDKLKKEIFSNPRYEIFYMIHYKKDGAEFVSPVLFEKRGDVWDTYLCDYSVYSVSSSEAIDDSSLREILNEDYEVIDELLDYYRTLVRGNKVYELSFSPCYNLPDEITVLEFLWQGPLLDWMLYCEGENPRGSKGYYYPTIFGEFAHLLNIYSSLDEENQKKFVKGLTTKQKAVLFGANPKYDIFNKPWIKEEFGYWIVTFDSSFTNEQAKEIYSIAKRRIADEEYDKLQKEQRSDRGYSDSDVWNYCHWFMDINSKMLRQLAKKHVGFPSVLEKDYFEKNKNSLFTQDYLEWISVSKTKTQQKQKDKACEVCDKQWTEILNRLAFLLDEMDEEKCSMARERDILLDKWSNTREEFETKYGSSGKLLKSEEDLQKEKEGKYVTWLGPSDLPKNDELRVRSEKAWKELNSYEKKMFKYRLKCKDEFFKLFSKYFYNIWD